jgi:acetyl-CoA carboxylase, biotin carboxylase subunit
VLRAGNYEGAGTVEFLLDKEGRFYFIEVNARLQVEHPVTEWVTGLDLVWEQICLAAGEPLSFQAEHASPKGAAIECRIYAEDPQKLLPKPGTVSRYLPAAGEGVRVDDWIADGVVVSPFYDPLVAKITAFGEDRATAISRLKKALQETVLEGLVNNIPLHLRIIEDPGFAAGNYSTQTLPQLLAKNI